MKVLQLFFREHRISSVAHFSHTKYLVEIAHSKIDNKFFIDFFPMKKMFILDENQNNYTKGSKTAKL